MNSIKILGTGLTGLVGSRIVELLSDKYTFENISRATDTDITNYDSIRAKIHTSEADIILHAAAYADVDGCEEDKLLGKNGEAWRVNVLGTQNIVDIAVASGKKIIYISTDFVFDGTKTVYNERDVPHPTNWYGQTKLEGEKIIQSSGTPFIILRIAYPYRAMFEKKRDFMRTIGARLKEGKPINVVSDQIMTPTFIDDIATALDGLIQTNAVGIYHAVGSQFITPYEAAVAIARTFGYDISLIGKTTRAQYFKNKAARGFRLALSNDKIQKLGIQMKTFQQGLWEVKKQQAI